MSTRQVCWDDCRRQLSNAPQLVAPLGKQPVVLYGAGGKGRECVGLLRAAGIEICAIIDQKPSAKIDGVAVCSPEDPLLRRLADESCTAIVSVFNFNVDPLPIHSLLAGIGFKRVIGMAALRQLFDVPDTFWLSAADEMTPPVAEAEWLFNRLADTESRQQLFEAIALRRTFDPSWLRRVNQLDQYLPEGVPLSRKGVRLIDGGAFNGDTIVSLQKLGCTFEAIAAFEPDPANFLSMQKTVSESGLNCEILLWPCGLDSTTRQLRFRSDGAASSGIDAHGESFIQTVAIDQAMPDFRPDYVKLDIEGAESAALTGMRETVIRSQPDMAVCVYHCPRDLWELPRAVDELLPDHRLYLRSHGWNGFDLVLYACRSVS